MYEGWISVCYVVVFGFDMFVGVVYCDGIFYIFVVLCIVCIGYIDDWFVRLFVFVVVINVLLIDYYYGWKFIVFGFDGKLYVLIGVLCNVCFVDCNCYVIIV